MENWNKFLVEQKAAVELDDLLSKTHASGRELPKGFGKITEDDDTSAAEIIKKITPEVIRKVISKYDSDSSGQIDVSKISDPIEIAIINSLLLFTAGKVATVRDPEKISDEDTEELQSPIMGNGFGKSTYVDSSRQDYKDDKRLPQHYKDRIRQGTRLPPYLLKPTKELYTIANHVLTQCGTMKSSGQNNKAIYRGLRIPEELYNDLKIGTTFNNKKISSWTTSKEIAKDWATDIGTDGKWCLLTVNKPQHGIDISSLSVYDHEDEYILGTPVVIKDIKTEDYSHLGAGIRTYYICEA